MRTLHRTLNRQIDWPILLLVVSFLAVMAKGVWDDRPQPENGLVVKQLTFEGGYFFQSVIPSLNQTLRAEWSAKIVHTDGTGVCSGYGVAPYRDTGQAKKMTPDYWAGDKCDLIVGGQYVATAIWEWNGPDGLPRSTSRSLQFTYEAPK